MGYRGHQPGEEFVATLDVNVERRAVDRGSIVLLERLTPAIAKGSYRLPEGWLDGMSVRPHHNHPKPGDSRVSR